MRDSVNLDWTDDVYVYYIISRLLLIGLFISRLLQFNSLDLHTNILNQSIFFQDRIGGTLKFTKGPCVLPLPSFGVGFATGIFSR